MTSATCSCGAVHHAPAEKQTFIWHPELNVEIRVRQQAGECLTCTQGRSLKEFDTTNGPWYKDGPLLVRRIVIEATKVVLQTNWAKFERRVKYDNGVRVSLLTFLRDARILAFQHDAMPCYEIRTDAGTTQNPYIPGGAIFFFTSLEEARGYRTVFYHEWLSIYKVELMDKHQQP